MEATAPPSLDQRVPGLKQVLRDAVRGFRFDEARNAFDELTQQCGVDPDSDDMLPPRVMMGIFEGRVRDTLQMLNDLGEDRALGLKAVCLQLIGDPLWEGLALQVAEESPDEAMRRSRRTLLTASDDD